MTLPQLNIYRHDRGRRALITLAGEIDPATAPQVRAALERCLHDGITTIDVDLTTVDRCDSSGLRVFLDASRHAAETHASLRLHHPSPQTARLLSALTLPRPQAATGRPHHRRRDPLPDRMARRRRRTPRPPGVSRQPHHQGSAAAVAGLFSGPGAGRSAIWSGPPGRADRR
jgi:anti-sigma B factor antagonist